MGGLTAASGGTSTVEGAAPAGPQFAPQAGPTAPSAGSNQAPAFEAMLSETRFTVRDLELAINILSLCVLLYWAHTEVR